jgi:hypothetical protein
VSERIRRVVLGGAVCLVAGLSLSARQLPQQRLPATIAPLPPAADAMSALVAEVKLLRQALEASAKTQAQVAALGVALSSQQARLVQVSSRLDAVRRDLDAAVAERGRSEAQLAALRAARTRPGVTRVDQEQIASMERELTSHLEDQRRVEEQARARENDLAASLAAEEARWTDLAGRLEPLFR